MTDYQANYQSTHRAGRTPILPHEAFKEGVMCGVMMCVGFAVLAWVLMR